MNVVVWLSTSTPPVVVLWFSATTFFTPLCATTSSHRCVQPLSSHRCVQLLLHTVVCNHFLHTVVCNFFLHTVVCNHFFTPLCATTFFTPLCATTSSHRCVQPFSSHRCVQLLLPLWCGLVHPLVPLLKLEGLTAGVSPDTIHPNTVSCRTGYPFLVLRFDNKIS